MSVHYILALILSLVVIISAYAADVPFNFENTAEAQRYHSMIKEIRCLVCQNQSLADSNAELAQDLRNEIYQMVLEGRANDEIIAFMVDRYGDFVLYRPPLKSTTFLLWFGPLLFFLTAVLVVMRVVRQHTAESSDQQLAENHKYP